MSCAVHPAAAVAAYCRDCGTALCEACQRSVRGVIYCENCLARRLNLQAPEEGRTAASSTPFAAVQPQAAPLPEARPGVSPGLAALLAGLFPFGVGQVYSGEYAKGLAHLVIFAFLVWGAQAAGGFAVFFGLGIAFFYVYQIIDAYRTAQAVQRGQAVPDPFGLARSFASTEQTQSAAARGGDGGVPAGALILIGLGILFLLRNVGWLHFFWLHRVWPVALIILGLWLLLRRARTASGPAEPLG